MRLMSQVETKKEPLISPLLSAYLLLPWGMTWRAFFLLLSRSFKALGCSHGSHDVFQSIEPLMSNPLPPFPLYKSYHFCVREEWGGKPNSPPCTFDLILPSITYFCIAKYLSLTDHISGPHMSAISQPSSPSCPPFFCRFPALPINWIIEIKNLG